MARKIITNCPDCNSANFGLGEYYYRYGPDSRYMICHDCGNEVDNPTEEELQYDKEFWEKWWTERKKKAKEERYVLYLKLKEEFKGESNELL